MFYTLARNEQFAIELNTTCPLHIANKNLTHGGHYCKCSCTEARRVHWHIAPGKNAQLRLCKYCFNTCNSKCNITGCLWHECQAHAVRASCRKFHTSYCTTKCIGNLNENARTVASIGFCTRGTTVLHVAQGTNTKSHNVVARNALHLRNERYAAGIVLKTRVVQTARSRIKM